MRLRSLSIRLRILLLVAIPILSLIGLYAYAATTTASNAINLSRSRTLKDTIGTPTGNFEAQIDAERLLAVAYLAAPVPSNLATLRAQEAKTQAAEEAFKNAAASSTGNASAADKQAIAGLLRRYRRPPGAALPDRLGDHQQAAGDQRVRQRHLRRRHGTEPDDPAGKQRPAGDPEPRPWSGSAGPRTYCWKRTRCINGDAISRTFSAADRQQFALLVGARRAVYAENLQDLEPTYRAYYIRNINPQALAALTALENKIIA